MEKLKRVEANLRTRSKKKRIEAETSSQAQPQTNTQNDPLGETDEELASALKQLETLKKEKEKFAQELQAQKLVANNLAMLNEAK